MSAINCITGKLASLINKRDHLLSKASEGVVRKKEIADLDQTIKIFEGSVKEATDLTESLKAKYGGDTIEATAKAAREAHAILTERYAFKMQNTLNARKYGKEDAEAIMKSIKSGSSIKDIVDQIHYGTFTPGKVPPRANMGKLSYTESVAANKSLLSAGIAKALDAEPGMMTKVLQSETYNDDIGRAWFELRNPEAPKSAKPESLKVAQKLQEQSLRWGDLLKERGVYLRASEDYLGGLDISTRAAQKMAKKDFVKLMMQHLDRAKVAEAAEMPTLATSDQIWGIFLEHTHDHFTTGGRVKMGDYAPIKSAGMSTVANSRGHQRILIPKDYDSWSAIQKSLGRTSKFMEHTYALADKAARDMAGAERYSVSPGLYIGNLINQLEKSNTLTAAKVHEELLKAFRPTFAPDGHWKNVAEPVRAIMGTLASQSRASVLGNIAPQALMEPLSSAASTYLHGNNPLRGLLDTITNTFNPRFTKDREAAAMMGKELYAFMEAFQGNPTDAGLSLMEKYAAWGTNLTMKYTGGQRVTNANRLGAVAQSENILIDWVKGGTPNERAQGYLNHFFLKEADKAIIEPYIIPDGKNTGAFTLDLEAMFANGNKSTVKVAQNLAARFANIEQVVAPDNSPKLDAWFKNLESSGIAQAIAAKGLKTFTGFMGGMYHNQMSPILSMKGAKKYEYLAAQAMFSIATSAMYIQFMRIAQGKDPLPFGAELVARSVIAAPLGMFGKVLFNGGIDGFAFADVSAVLRAASTHVKLPMHVIADLSNGKTPERIGQDAANIMKFWTPSSTAWPVRYLLDRFVYDQVEKGIDREQYLKRQAHEYGREANIGSGMFIDPMTKEITRAPDFSKITKVGKTNQSWHDVILGE